MIRLSKVLFGIFANTYTLLFALYRCKGIWDYIKNDGAQVKNVLKVSTSLSQKLSSGSGTACRQFLEDLSSSSFFVTALPKFINDIKTSIDHPDCRYYRLINNYLKVL